MVFVTVVLFFGASIIPSINGNFSDIKKFDGVASISTEQEMVINENSKGEELARIFGYIGLPLEEDETITTQVVISDIDNDGIDEIIVGTSYGTIYIYNHPDTTISLDTGAEIDCTPAVGDLNNDGYDEIVAGNDAGDVYVWDKDGNQILSCEVDGRCKQTVVLEDVTGDGQLEIIVPTWKYPDNYGMDGFHIIDPINDDVYSYDTEYRITRPFAVADVNNDSRKELVIPFKNGYYGHGHGSYILQTKCFFKVFSVSSDFTIEEIWEKVYGSYAPSDTPLSGPIVADIDEDGVVEIIINLMDTITSYYNCIRAYHFDQEQFVWFVNIPSPFPIVSSQLLVGNFLDSVQGLEIVTTAYDPNNLLSFYLIIDCYGNQVDKVYCGGDYTKPMLFSDINSDGNQEILGTIGDVVFWVRDNNGNELEQWSVNTSYLNPFVSLAMGKVTEDYDNYILLTTLNGTIFTLPIESFTTSVAEWAQYQNNARNTGCYFQPLPEDITYDITVKHNVLLDKTIRLLTPDVTLTIEYGNGILFKATGSIFGGNILSVGTETSPILFTGLCADSTKNYWNGISIAESIAENSTCHFEHCYLQNAVTALLLEDIKTQYIKNCIIKNNYKGIYLSDGSSDNNIIGNNITDNTYGIFFSDAVDNNIFGNNITDNNNHGIHFLSNAVDNIIYHNDFINNNNGGVQAFDNGENIWDDDSSEGNYWDDFDEPHEGAYDNNSDGIVDSPYSILGAGGNEDRYPFINPLWISQPNLYCDGSLSWTDVEPGSLVTGSFTVENIGDPGSELDWQITDWPSWGTWTFDPESGNNLKPEDGPVIVEVEVEAPGEENEGFSGEVKIVNVEDSSDYCTIQVSLVTSQSQPQPCFLAGTKISMIDGSYKNIEEILVGDIVKSYDTTNNRVIPGIVTETLQHKPEEMTPYYLNINNELRVTPNHCLYKNGEWIPADDVNVGDSLSTADTAVNSIKKVYKQVPTYDLEVQPLLTKPSSTGKTTAPLLHGSSGTTTQTQWHSLPYFADRYLAHKVHRLDRLVADPRVPV